MILCGLDEVGRGSLAGPLFGAAVVFGNKSHIDNIGLNDSKKMTTPQREEVYKKIIEIADKIEVEIIQVETINLMGMGWCNKELFVRLIDKVCADRFIVDGNIKVLVKDDGKNIVSLIKADSKIPEVMAASIVAKVERDKYMRKLHKKYEAYKWISNVGYGTREHIEAIRIHGICEHHRRIYVRNFV